MTIELTDKEAKQFVAFKKYQTIFETMDKAGVFDIRRGSAEIHFDERGEIGIINMHANIYNKREILIVGVGQ